MPSAKIYVESAFDRVILLEYIHWPDKTCLTHFPRQKQLSTSHRPDSFSHLQVLYSSFIQRQIWGRGVAILPSDAKIAIHITSELVIENYLVFYYRGSL